jgi:hypothetical protein
MFGREVVNTFEFEDEGVFYEDVGVVIAYAGAFVMDRE